jgi:hypothetical protein
MDKVCVLCAARTAGLCIIWMNSIPPVPRTQLRLSAWQLVSEDQTDEAWGAFETKECCFEYWGVSKELRVLSHQS